MGRGVYELVDDPREDSDVADDVADLRAKLNDARERQEIAEERVDQLRADLEDCRD